MPHRQDIQQDNYRHWKRRLDNRLMFELSAAHPQKLTMK
jgi:hypothetical protein